MQDYSISSALAMEILQFCNIANRNVILTIFLSLAVSQMFKTTPSGAANDENVPKWQFRSSLSKYGGMQRITSILRQVRQSL